jgi:hypothetical protein
MLAKLAVMDRATDIDRSRDADLSGYNCKYLILNGVSWFIAITAFIEAKEPMHSVRGVCQAQSKTG